MAENNTEPKVKGLRDYATEESRSMGAELLDKFNAATKAQFDIQREQNRQTENQFYNQMYNTQQTAMDTIRKSNAAAVSSGASRGVQAANELSALLGLQQESVQSATELAQQNRQTAQEETAAMLENVLNAYQQEAQDRNTLTQQAIEAESLEATKTEASAKQQEVDQLKRNALQSAAETGTKNYLTELANQGMDYSREETATQEGSASLDLALTSLSAKGKDIENNGIYFDANDFDSAWNTTLKGAQSNIAKDKINTLQTDVENICQIYGLQDAYNSGKFKSYFDAMYIETTPEQRNKSGTGFLWSYTKSDAARAAQLQYTALLSAIKSEYMKKGTTKQ